MAKFVWIASYPKSGNTWVRFLIANLLLKKVESSQQVMQQVPDIHDGISGAPGHSISQGKVIYANGKLDVTEGAGRYVNRPTFSVAHDAMRKQGDLKALKPVVRHTTE